MLGKQKVGGEVDGDGAVPFGEWVLVARRSGWTATLLTSTSHCGIQLQQFSMSDAEAASTRCHVHVLASSVLVGYECIGLVAGGKSATTTSAPSRESARATARPMPRAPPVTTATFPWPAARRRRRRHSRRIFETSSCGTNQFKSDDKRGDGNERKGARCVELHLAAYDL